jgi:hypothetical protein
MNEQVITEEQVTQAIIDFIEKYLKKEVINSAYDINNGWCGDFAEDVINSLGGETKKLFLICNENFMMGEDGDPDQNDVFDIDMIINHWPKVNPTNNLSWGDIKCIEFGYHEWIYFDGKHFDAEYPEGVENFFDLPIYQKYIMRYIQDNGSFAN